MIIGDYDENGLGAQWEPQPEHMRQAVSGGGRNGKEKEVAEKASWREHIPS